MDAKTTPAAAAQTLTLSVGGTSYSIVLPHAATDYIQGKLVKERKPYELEMLEDMRSRVEAGALVVDVGANIGNHSLYLAAIAECQVEAFEPNPELCEGLRRSVELNDLGRRVRVHEMGLGRVQATAHFGVNSPHNLGGQHLDVGDGPLRVEPLDGFGFDRPVAALKIDVEGMEIDVLDGSRVLLGRDRPLVYVECATEAGFRQVARWFERIDYDHWDTFNVTPTHLFIPAERLTTDRRLRQLQAKTAHREYRTTQLLREVRLRGTKIQVQQVVDEQQQVKRQLNTLQTAVVDLRKLLDERTRAASDMQAVRAETQASVRRLERTVEVKEFRLAATERREQALKEQLAQMRQSASFRIGQALIEAGRSWRAGLRLPLTLARVVRESRARDPLRPTVGGSSSRGSIAKRPGLVTPQQPSAAIDFPKAAPTATTLKGERASLGELRVAAVMDEFTSHAFAPECQLLPLSIAGWRSEVEGFKPDLVFIESAWQGAQGQWATKVSNPSSELAELIVWARSSGVPTLFWNKEDPVHFGVFLHVARAVDYVFTTDIDCIARYKREVGHDRVFLLPFAAQPASHNPIETFPRQSGFCFAGSYYLKYPERQRDFRSLIDTVRGLGPVEIFDRNFGRAHQHYEFPAEYQPLIVGSLPFDQIDKAYKGYRYGINMNTIKQSQTMFARRVFELMASNTVVVSNFSRGMRLMFGDLVVASDAPNELRRRLEALQDERAWRKFRLAGLRKVMSQHTYAHRLAYIARQIAGGGSTAPTQQRLCVIAFPADAQQARDFVEAFGLQTMVGAALCLVGPHVPRELANDSVHVAVNVGDLASLPAFTRAEWIAPLSASDYHGPNYLTDLLHATQYAAADGVGKAAHFELAAGSDKVELVSGELAYRRVDALPARSSLLRRGLWSTLAVEDAESLDAAVVRGGSLCAVDEFNYARQATLRAPAAVREAVDDMPGLRLGLDIEHELLARAERGTPPAEIAASGDAELAPGLPASELAELMPRKVHWTPLDDGRIAIDIAIPEGKHHYIYLTRVFARKDLNLELNSRVQWLCTGTDGLEVRTVFEFLDENQQKISHAINKAGDAVSLPIPAHCQFVRIGLRFVGSGTLTIGRLVLADVRERPTVLVGSARNLVLVKQYPDYDDLYKYGFVHSRLRAYARAGVACDVFRLVADEPFVCREFENVDVTAGDRDLLDLALQSGQYRHVLVHLMDRAMWEVLERHLEQVHVTVWVHGAEIQVWQRRAFEFERMDPAEVDRQKALSDKRVTFWRGVLASQHPHLRLVFVSTTSHRRR